MGDQSRGWVPSGRAINPITNTNWEGTGVKPHIEINASDALDKAHLVAIEDLIKKAPENIIEELKWVKDGIKAKAESVEVDKEILKTYIGSYGPRKIVFEDGKLYYQREGRPKYELHPMSMDKFYIEEIPYFRIKFVKENGTVKKLIGLYQDRSPDENYKDIKS